MIDFFTSEPMRYWSFNTAMTSNAKRQHLEQLIQSNNYIWSRKYDGNWSRAIITSDRAALQTRGISKKTGTYGEVQNKVFFWNDVVNAFQSGITVILGEIYLPGGIDRDVGSILRCLDEKAIARQKSNKLEWRIFDVLAFDGIELINTPIENRIKYIPKVVQRINNPLVIGIDYYEMDNNFFENLNNIFSEGGEGAVCFKKTAIYEPGKRGPHSWDSVKVKQEISADIDCFITGIEPAIRDYTGKELGSWSFWQDCRTDEKIIGNLFGEYRTGRAIRPISKGFYYNWPGAIHVGVYDKNHQIVELCKVAGLTEDFKNELRDNFQKYYLCPVTIGGMALSDANGLSVRHPYIKSIRMNDLNIDSDCTLEKILQEN